MEIINKDLILAEIRLFSGLNQRERNIIKRRSDFIEYKKGKTIYKEGAPADAFNCIILGRVVVYTQDKEGNKTILECLHRGKYFGIISLLTGDSHSVSAEAMNDCLILTIKKEDFDFILRKIPRLAIDLSQTLSRRLKRKDIHQKTIFESTIVSVLSSSSGVGKTVYSLNLALSLYKEAHKPVIMLDVLGQGETHTLPKKLEIKSGYPILDLSNRRVDTVGVIKDFILKSNFNIDLICISYKTNDDISTKRLIDVLSLLVNDYNYIILDLPSVTHMPVLRILNQSDLVHVLTNAEIKELMMTHQLIKRLKKEYGFKNSKIKIIINDYKLTNVKSEQEVRILGHDIFATLPKIDSSVSDRVILDSPGSEYAHTVKRISRELGDCMVGLALGVGVAYGFCHIGVLKVIEEENIPIDVISGSSIGALIAALWATGKSAEEIFEITREFQEPKSFWKMMDFTFPWKGFIKGNKLYNFLKKYLGDKTFYDVDLPLKIIASDVKKKQPLLIDKGKIVDAVMSSCSMPGVFRPFKPKQEMLFDGGITNPLPTEPLFKMGVRKIIAVNVTPASEDVTRQYDKMKKDAAAGLEEAKAKKRSILGQYFKKKLKTNLLDIIFSTIEVMQSKIAKKEEKLADVVLHPDTSGLYWLELHRAAEFVQRGEIEARKHLDHIWQVVNE
ncbi:MAG TPA: cyclic nucleotide-binding domain-containing protein [Candidatus Omnitrophica bacterium]|nr:cyclic nucleotide-binding domain-containing protein [Candidatus Omnitrophota bacterium]